MTGLRDAMVLITLKPRPRILRPIVEFARTTRVNMIVLTDQDNAAWAQRLSQIVLVCHTESHTIGPSGTALASMVRLLAAAFTARTGAPATERANVIADIHEELGDLE